MYIRGTLRDVDDGYRWSRIGGHLALDLCNTVSWRLDPARRIERLTGPAALADWYTAMTGTPPAPAPGAPAVRAVLRLRAALTAVIDAHLDAHTPADGDVPDGGVP